MAVVNELFAHHYWPGQDPIGKRLRLQNEGRAESRVEVVGVAKNSKYLLLAERPTGEGVVTPYESSSARRLYDRLTATRPISAASARRSPMRSAIVIVMPERDTPGTRAAAWAIQ